MGLFSLWHIAIFRGFLGVNKKENFHAENMQQNREEALPW
jgi:hypothetical protein